MIQIRTNVHINPLANRIPLIGKYSGTEVFTAHEKGALHVENLCLTTGVLVAIYGNNEADSNHTDYYVVNGIVVILGYKSGTLDAVGMVLVLPDYIASEAALLEDQVSIKINQN